jgi:hypothetical protein
MSETLPAKVKKLLLLEDLKLHPEIMDDQNPLCFMILGKLSGSVKG